MFLLLTRDAIQPRPEQSTLGVLSVASETFQIMERPWVQSPDGPGGVPNISCVPLGTYRMVPRVTEARGHHWILSNPALGIYQYPADIPAGVIARCLVLMHAANWAHELEGCIAPGKMRAPPKQNGNPFDEWMITASRNALDEIGVLAGPGEHQLAVGQ